MRATWLRTPSAARTARADTCLVQSLPRRRTTTEGTLALWLECGEIMTIMPVGPARSDAW